MKIFNSIKWRLQIWYGLILVIVLAGFGFTAYQLEIHRQFSRIDDELKRRFAVIADALHGTQQRRPPPDGLPPDQRPDDNSPGQNSRQPGKFELPPQAAHLFDASDPKGFYFVILSSDGREIASGGNVQPFGKTLPSDSANQPGNPPKPPFAQIVGETYLISVRVPSGENVLLGCSIAQELKELHLTAMKLSGFGGIILIFGLAGGWWFVSRALRPIESISAAAVKISAGDLSQRINVAEAESELGQLAAVLNSTFARLESAFAQQKQFASDAAHELRTPVAVILTQTQTALNRERDAASYKETVEACQRAAQRMRKLIKSLLELARLDAGQEKLKRLQFDFSKTVEDCVELIRPIAEERRVKIIPELEPLEISGDSERLAQVVTNLLTNAIQYNRDGGEVRVKLKIKDGFAALKISDTGTGISTEDLPHVFKRFYRGDKSRTGASNSGLGLAISKAIVEAHGGTIEVASKEDAGAIFRVKLPLP
jgi:two-component system OmpR family sensor kinase